VMGGKCSRRLWCSLLDAFVIDTVVVWLLKISLLFIYLFLLHLTTFSIAKIGLL
jgi:hypothetical protein